MVLEVSLALTLHTLSQHHSLLIKPPKEDISIKVNNTGRERVSLGGYKLYGTGDNNPSDTHKPCKDTLS